MLVGYVLTAPYCEMLSGTVGRMLPKLKAVVCTLCCLSWGSIEEGRGSTK